MLVSCWNSAGMTITGTNADEDESESSSNGERGCWLMMISPFSGTRGEGEAEVEQTLAIVFFHWRRRQSTSEADCAAVAPSEVAGVGSSVE